MKIKKDNSNAIYCNRKIYRYPQKPPISAEEKAAFAAFSDKNTNFYTGQKKPKYSVIFTVYKILQEVFMFLQITNQEAIIAVSFIILMIIREVKKK